MIAREVELLSNPTVSANLPGIEASTPAAPPACTPRSGFRLRSPTEVGITTSLFCRKTHHRASAEGPGDMLSSQHNSRNVFSITGPAPEVRQQGCPRTRCRQSGVATGLPLSILAWQQDCPCQSWRGHRIAPPNPVLATGLARCTTSSSGLELFLPEHRLVMESAPL